MPMSSWEDVAGKTCEADGCTNPATHYYGYYAICCQCHGGNMITPEEAAAKHKSVLDKQNEIPKSIYPQNLEYLENLYINPQFEQFRDKTISIEFPEPLKREQLNARDQDGNSDA